MYFYSAIHLEFLIWKVISAVLDTSAPGPYRPPDFGTFSRYPSMTHARVTSVLFAISGTCAVDVVAEITEDINVEVKEEDIRVDVYRSSGKGGQGVNTTDSAVRLTHAPTGIVVVCQNERSQIKNKAAAMNVLKARIYEKRQDEQRAEMDKFYGEKGEIGFGAQIRSYVLQPYQMVKDLRTGISTSDTQGVLDGDLDRFVNAWLRAGCPRHRNKDIQMDE